MYIDPLYLYTCINLYTINSTFFYVKVTLRCLTRGDNKVSCINEDEDNLGPAMVIDKSKCGPLKVKVFYKVCNKAPYEFELNQPKTKLIFETVRQEGFRGDIIPPHQCKKVKIKKTINTCERIHAMSIQVTGASLVPFLDGSDIKKIYGYCYLFRRTTMEYASPSLPTIDN